MPAFGDADQASSTLQEEGPRVGIRSERVGSG